MKRFQGVTKRPGTSVWQWGIKPPSDLKSLYPTQWAHRCSLGTTDLKEANLKASLLFAEWTQRFEGQRQRLKDSAKPPRPVEAPRTTPTVITPEIADALSRGIRRRVLWVDEYVRSSQEEAFWFITDALASKPRLAQKFIDNGIPTHYSDPTQSAPSALSGLTDVQAKALALSNELDEKQVSNALARHQVTPVILEVQRVARQLGFDFHTDTPGAREALFKCMGAWRDAIREVRRRDAGDFVETPPEPSPLVSVTAPETPTAQTPSSPSARLRDVLPQWKAAKKRKAQTVQAAELALALYEEATGNPPLAQLKRSHGVDFKAWLLERDTASSTAADRLNAVKGFLNFAALELEIIPKNPWERLSIEVKTQNPRSPWTSEQLHALLERPLFTQYRLPKSTRAGLDAAYWLPILGMFTGARVSELAQLRTADVTQTNGVHIFRITNEGDGQTVKTDAGRRIVPIHSQLVSLGFLEYVEAIRAAGAVSLWPVLPVRTEKPGDYFSRWFSEVRKGTDLPDFHSFRHTVRSRLASAEVSEPLMDTLLGHEVKGSEGARTYTHRSEQDLSRALEKLAYPELNLPRVFTAPAWTPTK